MTTATNKTSGLTAERNAPSESCVPADHLPSVSLIIPCRDAGLFIGGCLNSILASDYPKDRLEVLVVDGMSEDASRGVVEGYAKQWAFIRLLDNPSKITPAGLNIGIAGARGDIIMRLDSHSTFEPNYIRTCVEGLMETGAESVGGLRRFIPRENSFWGSTIVRALGHWFGAGDAYYRFVTSDSDPRWVDTVPFFCCRKEVLQAVGPFNESLLRGEDMEFNRRLKEMAKNGNRLSAGETSKRRAAGLSHSADSVGKLPTVGRSILLLPKAVTYYSARSSFKDFCQHNWTNGIWAVLPFAFTDIVPVCWRHIVPLLFVASLGGALALSSLIPICEWIFGGMVTVYLLGSLLVSARIAKSDRNWKYLFTLPVIFAVLHLTYGLGSLWGLCRALFLPQFWKRVFNSPKHSHGPNRDRK
jgi:glycosyltransferase involved in cell wall biosynthesis